MVKNQLFEVLDMKSVDPCFLREAWLHNVAWQTLSRARSSSTKTWRISAMHKVFSTDAEARITLTYCCHCILAMNIVYN